MFRTEYLSLIVVLLVGLCQVGCDNSAKSNGTEAETTDGLDIETGVPFEIGGGESSDTTSEGTSTETTPEVSVETSASSDSSESETTDSQETGELSSTESGSTEGPVLQPPQNADPSQ